MLSVVIVPHHGSLPQLISLFYPPVDAFFDFLSSITPISDTDALVVLVVLLILFFIFIYAHIRK